MIIYGVIFARETGLKVHIEGRKTFKILLQTLRDPTLITFKLKHRNATFHPQNPTNPRSPINHPHAALLATALGVGTSATRRSPCASPIATGLLVRACSAAGGVGGFAGAAPTSSRDARAISGSPACRAAGPPSPPPINKSPPQPQRAPGASAGTPPPTPTRERLS